MANEQTKAQPSCSSPQQSDHAVADFNPAESDSVRNRRAQAAPRQQDETWLNSLPVATRSIAEHLERELVDPCEYDKEFLRKIGVKSYRTKEGNRVQLFWQPVGLVIAIAGIVLSALLVLRNRLLRASPVQQ